MGRAALQLGVRELAKAAEVSPTTVTDFEGGKRTPHPRTVAAIRAALEAAGIDFTDGEAPGVKLRSAILLLWSPDIVGVAVGDGAPSTSREWFLTLDKALERVRERWPEIRARTPQIVDRERRILRSTEELMREMDSP